MGFLEVIAEDDVHGRRRDPPQDPVTRGSLDDDLLNAKLLYRLKWYELAAREAERVARDSPEDTRVCWLLAACYVRLGRLDDAVARLRRLMSVCPTHRDAWALLGVLETQIAAREGRHEDVIALGRAHLQKADSLGYSDTHKVVLGRIAHACCEVGRMEEAVDAQRRVVALFPRDSQAWLKLASLEICSAERSGRLEDVVDVARAHLEDARGLGHVELEVLAHSRISSACAALGRHREALEAQRRVAQLQPHDVRCQLVLLLREIAVASGGKGRGAEDVVRLATSGLRICRDLDYTESLKAEVGELHRAQVLAFLELGKLHAALLAAREFQAHSPEDPQAYRWLSDILDRMNRPAEAVEARLKLIELVPHDRKAKVVLKRRLKELLKASQQLQEGATCCPADGIDRWAAPTAVQHLCHSF